MADAKIPKTMQARYDEIVTIIDAVCKEHLNQGYADLCRRLAGALARKRPSPLASGQVKSWACAITYAIGKVNFLFDPSQTPHMRADELCDLFSVSPATGSAKSRQIFDLMDMMQMDPRWCVPEMLERNPLTWMLSVNGLIVDVRHMPREVQEEAFRKGLIPYIPDDKTEGGE